MATSSKFLRVFVGFRESLSVEYSADDNNDDSTLVTSCDESTTT